jgi:putative transposase
MIDRTHRLSVGRQAQALGISRGSVYYLPQPTREADLALMRRIDELHLDHPFAGSRMLQGLLKAEGHEVGRLHVSTLMKKMGIEALYRRPKTTKPAPGHKVYPYLLRNMDITRPNQVWAMDITYVPMARGFVYLAAVIDWYSRRVLAWRLSITLSADFCIEALDEALTRHGQPDIFNTDQGCQFTSSDFIDVLRPPRSPSAWTAGAPGGTTSSSSASGGRSSTKRSTCAPTPASPRPAPRSAAISPSTTARGRIHRLAGRRPTGHTSPRSSQSRPRHKQADIHSAMARILFRKAEPPLLQESGARVTASRPQSRSPFSEAA